MTEAHAAADQASYQLLLYERQIVEEVLEQDALCITAAGLGWHKIVTAILRMHDSPGSGIVLLLGATSWQRQLLCAELARADPGLQPPVDINNEVPAWQRAQLYNPMQQLEAGNGNNGQPGDSNAAGGADAAAAYTASGADASAASAVVPGNQPVKFGLSAVDAVAGSAAGCVATTDMLGPDSSVTAAANAAAQVTAANGAASTHGSSGSGRKRQCTAYFITTRILVVDILSHRVRPQQIAGMIILNAHRVTETSGESFAVRLYRQGTGQGFELAPNMGGNNQGFVRAFSDSANAFAAGFNKVEKVMKALQVRRLLLFPRFHQSVKDSLEATPPELEEWEQDPSPSQLSLLEAVREVLSALLKELARANKLDLADISPDEGLTRPLDRAVRQQLDAFWHTLGWRSRTAVKDLATVQALAGALLSYDAVTFLRHLESVRLSESGSSIWLFHEATHVLYEQARRRVYKTVITLNASAGDTSTTQQHQQRGRQGGPAAGRGGARKRSKPPTAAAAAAATSDPANQDASARPVKMSKSSSNATAAASATAAAAGTARIEPVLEPPPKWELLLHLLEEVRQQRQLLLQTAANAEVVSEEQVLAEQQAAKHGTYGEAQTKVAVKVEEEQLQQPQQQQQATSNASGVEVVELLDSSDDGEQHSDHVRQQQHPHQQQRWPHVANHDTKQRWTIAAVAALHEAATAPLLIVCRELHSLHQLEQVVKDGPQAVMKQLYHNYLRDQLAAQQHTRGSSRNRRRTSAAGKGRGGHTQEAAGQQQEGVAIPQQQQQQLSAGVVGAGAAGGRGGSRGRGGGRAAWDSARHRDVNGALWAGRGPAVVAVEQKALLEAARQLQAEDEQQQQQGQAEQQEHHHQQLAGQGRGGRRGRGRAGATTAAIAVSVGPGSAVGPILQRKHHQQQRTNWGDSASDGSSSYGCGDNSSSGELESDRDNPAALAAGPHSKRGQWQQNGRQQQHSRQRQRQRKHKQQQQQQHPNQVAVDSSTAFNASSSGSDWQIHFYALDSQDSMVLWRLNPGFIILYDSDFAFLRQVEVYQAERSLHRHSVPVRMYQVYYAASTDKAAFLAATSRESSMFGDLIRAKQHLVIPVDMGKDSLQQLLPAFQEQVQAFQVHRRTLGRNALAPGPHAPNPNDLWLDVYSSNALSRIGGLTRRLKPVACRLVVDVREFMSGLPAVLHQQGFRLVPVTLEVGDYVLSPEIVVERKALPDLFASLGSGRLYNQVEAMVKAYKTPIVLIEFDEDKTFALTGAAEVAHDLDSRAPQARLVLLLLHFPKLRLLWSRSQHATGELFLALKRNQEEPDAAAAAIVGVPAAAVDATAAAAAAGAAPQSTTVAAGSSGAGTAGAPAAAGGGSDAWAGPSSTGAASALVPVAPPGVKNPADDLAQVAAVAQESVVNQAAIDFLRRLPGVTDSNWRLIINSVSSLQELAGLSVQQLEEIMGGARAAKALHDFLHAPCPVAQATGLGLSAV